MKNLSRWQRLLLAAAAVALVAGATFIISSANRKSPVLDTVPKDVVEKNNEIIRQFPKGDRAGRGGGILVSPTEILVTDAQIGAALPVRVLNRSGQPQKLSFSFLPVNRSLPGGAPAIEESARNIKRGRELVSLNADELTLRPGQAYDLRAVVRSEPSGGVLVGSIGVTIGDPRPRQSDPARNDVEVMIQNNVRINTMVYMTWPGAEDETVALERVRAVQDEAGELEFRVQVKGGPGIASPKGQVVIVNSSGQRIDGALLENNQRVIPGARRDLLLRKGFRLPPGTYEAQATLFAAGSRQEVSWPFEIASDGRLPAPGAEVALRINPVQAEPGQPVVVRQSIRNSGTKNFQPSGQATLFRLGENRVLGQDSFQTEILAPGDISESSTEFTAPDQPGNYEVIVDISAEDETRLDQRVVSFVVLADPPPPPGTVDRLRDWMSDNPFGAAGVGIIFFAILMIIFVAIVAISGRARRD